MTYREMREAEERRQVRWNAARVALIILMLIAAALIWSAKHP
jgi:hypothetical protein